MKIYFVRHGESEFNRLDIHQHKNVQLSATGIRQAKFIAKRFLKIPIDCILSSDYLRTRRTAEIIEKVLQKKIEFFSSLREFKWPSEMEGKPYNDPEAIRIKKIIREHMNDPTWHYSDEENFFDFRKRVSLFLGDVVRRKEKSVLAITHGRYIQMCFGLLLLGSEILQEEYKNIGEKLHHKNTGITLFEYRENGTWHLVTWNDHAHLG